MLNYIISIHAPLARCDIYHAYHSYNSFDNFNPRTSCEVRHSFSINLYCLRLFQSTHLLRGATADDPLDEQPGRISIHAPLARCDSIQRRSRPSFWCYFNPRTSCEVRRELLLFCVLSTVFQSTHLLRGATFGSPQGVVNHTDFNPRTSCEVRPTHPAAGPYPLSHFNPRTSCEVRLFRRDHDLLNE